MKTRNACAGFTTRHVRMKPGRLAGGAGDMVLSLTRARSPGAMLIGMLIDALTVGTP
jgi:hypothetical protein